MATAAQITANRLNSQLSTGPRTATGKTASSRNAIRHNLSPGATFTLLPGEDAAAFKQLVHDYRDEFKPRTAHELFLVNQMIQAQWRISRIERLQAEVLDKILNAPVADGKSDEGAIVAAMGFAHGDALDRLERYGRATERAYFRANKELKQYRAAKQNEAKTPALEEVGARGVDSNVGDTATAPPVKTNPNSATPVRNLSHTVAGHCPLPHPGASVALHTVVGSDDKSPAL